MKRSPMPPRTTPLRCASSLSRVSPTRKAALATVTPLPQRRRKDTGPDKATRKLLWERAGGRCELCWLSVGLVPHHRKPRGIGGTVDPAINRLSNLLLLCPACHLGTKGVERERLRAYDLGHLVYRNHDPRTTPVLLLAHGRVLLDDEGGYEPCPPSPDRNVA